MNHNYYYALLGTRAGGTAAAQSNCSDSLQFRYMYTDQASTLVGANGDTLADWEGMVFGGIVEVWADTQQIGVGTRFYTNSALTQEVSVLDGNWFRVENLIFAYTTGVGITTLTQINEPPLIQIRISDPSASSCNLSGPYNQIVFVARDQWQQVDRLWLDQSLTQPFAGGGSWYHVTDNDIPSAGTTLQINNCGWVVGFFAC